MATAEPLAIVDALTSTVDYLRISVGPTEGDWLRCRQLLDEPDTLAALVRATAPERGTDRDDVAASLFVQGYSFRIATVAIGSWLLSGSVLDTAPSATSIALGRGQPNAVRLDDARLVGTSTGTGALADLHASLVDGHLAWLVDAARAAFRVGAPLLWGNVAAACASSFGAVAGELPDRRLEIRERFEQFLATARPEISRAGHLVPVADRFAWERTSCCLWYHTTSGFMCEDCSLQPPAERAARYAALAAEPPAAS